MKMKAGTHSVPIGLIERTLLLDAHQLHVDLLGQDIYRVAPKPCHHHGPQVSNVWTLAEGGDPPTHTILKRGGVKRVCQGLTGEELRLEWVCGYDPLKDNIKGCSYYKFVGDCG